jgi:hypothetical protein
MFAHANPFFAAKACGTSSPMPLNLKKQKDYQGGGSVFKSQLLMVF